MVINYFIWFEDKNANYIPVDLNTSQSSQRANVMKNENFNNEKYFNRNKSSYLNIEQKTSFPIGITLDSYYDLLRKLCYPNAPSESLSCYELICLHSITATEKLINDQCVSLATLLSQSKKNK